VARRSQGKPPGADRPPRLGRVGLAVALAVALLGSVHAGDASTGRTPPPLVPSTSRWVDAQHRLLEVSFADPLVDPPLATVRARVLLPSDYASSGKTYPVLYLLHGAGDTAAAWTANSDGQQSLADFTAGKDVVVVMPDGGQNKDAGWYSDWFNGGAFGAPAWETFHLGQLIPWIERTFRVRQDRDGRVVAGLSMGGYGAMEYAARHPDLFAGAYSFSGAVDTDAVPYVEPIAFQALHDRFGTPTDRVWGSWQDQEVRWRGHSPVDLATNLRDVRLWLTTGMGVPGGPAPDDSDPGGLFTEAFIFEMNQVFDLTLNQDGIAHTFRPYPMGGHNWWHWQNDLHQAWPDIMATFASHTTSPASFDYRTIEPSFDLWGWHVEAHRQVTEFLTMSSVSGRLSLTGSGTVDLVTPPAYIPGLPYSLTVAGRTLSVVADSDSRLRFSVPLGPSHTLQEDTTAQRVAAATDPAYWETATVTIATGGTAGSGATPAASEPAPAIAALPSTSGAQGSRPAAAILALVALLGVRGVTRFAGRRRRSHG
jgi:S-formylglutathione hydrolase FrmB